ncbi:flagellar motor protein MotB [Pseudomonas profundi]|uniref:flagellar motor protein MotB n=1 Tax=Pseudomonas profundi TaxID=1981513 RepID=UPI00123964D6|nr:flagellar motor protein MotB [Pseudomonas profundi]
MKQKQGHDEITIIKRRSKKGHEEAHSGAWKVAFADFTLAMMALFMVLWLVQAMKVEQEAELRKSVGSPIWEGGAGIFDGSSPLIVEPVSAPPPVALTEAEYERSIDSTQHLGQASLAELKDLAVLMNDMAVEVGAETNLQVEVVPQGLRILVKDDQDRFMFQRGSANLTEHFHGLLTRLASVLGRVDNKLIISGHTDATPYRSNAGYNNWNLSGDRALRARNVLVDAGLPAHSILQVTAQADGVLLLPEQPESGANRRIELLLLTTHAETLYRDLFGERSAQVHFSEQGADYRSSAPETL